jgi:hypothetical protein
MVGRGCGLASFAWLPLSWLAADPITIHASSRTIILAIIIIGYLRLLPFQTPPSPKTDYS